MSKFVRVQFDDDSLWDIPAEVIAQHRTDYYTMNDPTVDRDVEFRISMDDDELLDWAANNMDWEDVREHAEEVPTIPWDPDYGDQWTNAYREIVIFEGGREIESVVE